MAKIFIIGDELTVTGLNMVGFAGNTEVAREDNIQEVFDRNKDKQIICITHTLFDKIRKYIQNFRSQHPNSIIIELPDMNGKGEDIAWKMLTQAIGEDRAKALAKNYK